MLGLEQSATYMAEVQNFLAWTVGGIVHRLREKMPDAFDNDILLQRMMQSLSLSVEHLAEETLSLRALAVIRRREHVLSFFPKRFNPEDRNALKVAPYAGPLLFEDDQVRSADSRTSSRESQMALSRVAYGQHQRQGQGRQQKQQQYASKKSSQRRRDSSSNYSNPRPPPQANQAASSSRRQQTPPRRQEERRSRERTPRSPRRDAGRGQKRKRSSSSRGYRRRGDFRR